MRNLLRQKYFILNVHKILMRTAPSVMSKQQLYCLVALRGSSIHYYIIKITGVLGT